MDPANKIVKEEVAILMVSGSYESIEEIAAIGKRLLGPTAVYVKKPAGSAAPPSGAIRRTGAAPAKENGVVSMASNLMASHSSNKLHATILPTFANVLKPNHLPMPASKVRSPVTASRPELLALASGK